MNAPLRLCLLFSVLILSFSAAKAQPVLPEIATATSNGVNFLSWTNQYDGIRSIAVQRSPDSVFNWTVIGFVKNLKKGPQAYIDGHPRPGKNYYRLEIVFNSDLHWFSNTMQLFIDSSALQNQPVLPPNDSLQHNVTDLIKSGVMAVTSDKDSVTIPISIPETKAEQQVSFPRSKYVFTNPFTGHINVEIGPLEGHRYSLEFFNDKNRMVLQIPRISEPTVIIDKRNFQQKGLYKFQLFKDKELLETGYVTLY